MDGPETSVTAAAWHPDPLSDGHRLRWWAGDHWTASVVESPVSTPTIAWCPELGEQLPPIQWGTPILRIATAPPLTFRPLAQIGTPPVPALPAPAPALALLPGGRAEPAQRARRRRRNLVVLAAALLLIVPGVASAALLTPSPSRPVLADVVAYRDRAAGFSLLHPRSWRVARANRGQGVQLLAGPARVADDHLATVSIATGADRGPLPSLTEFEQAATDELRVQYPGLLLADGADTTLAGGLARRASFTVSSSPLTIIEVAGRTADQRPLTVTVTTPDPQYAPSTAALHDLLASIR